MNTKRFLQENMFDEGGLGGHMDYPYGFDNLTFVDLFELIDDLFNARLERVTEKLDGQNIFVTMSPSGEIRFGRNGSDAIKGGFDREEILRKWEGQENVKNIYSRAYDIFSDSLKGLNPGFFSMGDAQIWMNCEVINTENPNVIPYSDNKVSVHGLVAFKNGTKEEVEIPDYNQKIAVLKNAVENSHSEYGKAQLTPEILLKASENAREQASEFKKALNDVIVSAGENAYPSMKIGDWKRIRKKNVMIENGYAALFNLGEFSDILEKRLLDGKSDGEYHLNNIKKWLASNKPEMKNEILGLLDRYKKEATQIMKKMIAPMEDFFVNLGTVIIENASGYENEGRYGEVIKYLTDKLEEKKIDIQTNFMNTDEYTKYLLYLEKLKNAGNKLNAMEGIVFNWRGMTMKLTGCFAPLNQIMGIGKYNR